MGLQEVSHSWLATPGSIRKISIQTKKNIENIRFRSLVSQRHRRLNFLFDHSRKHKDFAFGLEPIFQVSTVLFASHFV